MNTKTNPRPVFWIRALAGGIALAGLFFLLRAVLPSRGAAAPPPGQAFTNSLGLAFVSVPGTKVMFCIWLARVRDFEQFVNESGYHEADMLSLDKSDPKPVAPSWKLPGFSQSGDNPVFLVSWSDATNFCGWLTRKELSTGLLKSGQSYRLPTDSEWSLAAGPTKYPWGDNYPPPRDAGNYFGGRPRPVGSFKPNAHGLFDMGGNLWQSCDDVYRKEMNSEGTRKRFPVFDDDGGGMKMKVLRGASFRTSGEQRLASDCRSGVVPYDRNGSRGFRIVLAPSSP
jgi:formylglycine-generating enzyme required for sulfatase activity